VDFRPQFPGNQMIRRPIFDKKRKSCFYRHAGPVDISQAVFIFFTNFRDVVCKDYFWIRYLAGLSFPLLSRSPVDRSPFSADY